MRSYIFLIILLGFIQYVFCLEISNFTEDVCPVTWFRRKRANMDYTRWRSNIDTTPEFIVKVLDEDIPPTKAKQVVAVNIMPATKRGEKIIVGGAMVPPTTVSPSIEDINKEYTRFVPPTTVVASKKEHRMIGYVPISTASSVEFVDPASPEYSRNLLNFFPINQVERNPFRDDSPPASPHFMGRSASVPAQQFAPIAPVAFTRTTNDAYMNRETRSTDIKSPTRSTTVNYQPTRTTSNYVSLQEFLEEIINDNEVILTRSTSKPDQSRTSSPKTEHPFLFYYEADASTKFSKYSDDIASVVEDTTNVPFDLRAKDSDLGVMNRDEHEGYLTTFKIKEVGDSFGVYKTTETPDDYRYEDKNTPKKVPEKTLKETGTVSESDSFDELPEIDNKIDNKTSGMEYEYVSETEAAVQNGTTSSVILDLNLQKDVKDEPLKVHDERTREKRRPVCNMIKLRTLNFNSPRTLPEIVAQLKQWTEESPLVRWTDITEGNLTTMENPIYLMVVDDPSVGQMVWEKQNVLLVSGILGRDHHAVAASMYLLYQLIERSETHFDLLSKYRFWVIPVFNPDGYDYSLTFPQRREWVKNLRQTWDICKGRDSCKNCATYGLRCTISPCYGVNLDRNFEYQWIPPEELRAEHPCGTLYAGTRQLSEAETQALTNYLHKQKMIISVFVAFKEGETLGVMYPYSHTRKRRAFDQVYRQRASRAAASAASVSGRTYVAGQTSEFLPLYAGGIEDWADGHLGIDNTYTIMMFRPSDQQAKVNTERIVHEAYAAIDSLLLSSTTNTLNPVMPMARAKATSLHCSIFTVFFASLKSYLYVVLNRNIEI